MANDTIRGLTCSRERNFPEYSAGLYDEGGINRPRDVERCPYPKPHSTSSCRRRPCSCEAAQPRPGRGVHGLCPKVRDHRRDVVQHGHGGSEGALVREIDASKGWVGSPLRRIQFRLSYGHGVRRFGVSRPDGSHALPARHAGRIRAWSEFRSEGAVATRLSGPREDRRHCIGGGGPTRKGVVLTTAFSGFPYRRDAHPQAGQESAAIGLRQPAGERLASEAKTVRPPGWRADHRYDGWTQPGDERRCRFLTTHRIETPRSPATSPPPTPETTRS